MKYEDMTAENFREEKKNAKLHKALEYLWRERDDTNAILYTDEVNKAILKEIESRGFKIKFVKKSRKNGEAHYVVSW
jgi:hypothetical protein